MKARFLGLTVVLAIAFGAPFALRPSQASDSITWSVEVVPDPDDVGWWNSIETDSLGHPHISYSNYDDVKLKYAFHDGTTWHIEKLDEVGSTSDIALDAGDNPHISYYDDNANVLKYTVRDSAGWHPQVVDTDPEDAGAYTSVVVDSHGYPQIAYQGHRYIYPQTAKYAYWDGSAWQIATIDTVGNVGFDTSLALDANDHRHLLYLDAATLSLRYAYHDGTAWQFSHVIDSASGQLALDNQDRPAVAAISGSDLKYGVFDGSAWQFEVVDTDVSASPNYPPQTTLDFDAQNHPHIAYQDNNTLRIMYAYSDGTAWQIEDVAPGCTVISDCHMSLSVDLMGQPHIVWMDRAQLKLMYAVGRRPYDFTGFFAPVENLPALNKVMAGQTIPLKFSLGGDEGLGILAAGYPASAQVACGETADDATTPTSALGDGGLMYNATTDAYQYQWKTEKAWAGTCRTLVMKLSDGSIHRANFRFR